MKTLRKIVHSEINQLVTNRLSKIRSFSGSFCETDSSSNEKFSRHLVVHMPENLVFATTQDCGYFVQRISDARERYISLSSDNTWKSLIVNKDTGKVSIMDHSVNTSNHNFRILESAKFVDLGRKHLHL